MYDCSLTGGELPVNTILDTSLNCRGRPPPRARLSLKGSSETSRRATNRAIRQRHVPCVYVAVGILCSGKEFVLSIRAQVLVLIAPLACASPPEDAEGGGGRPDSDINLWPYFSHKAFAGFAETGKGFYSVYGNLFASLAQQEMTLDPEIEPPDFGGAQASAPEVLAALC